MLMTPTSPTHRRLPPLLQSFPLGPFILLCTLPPNLAAGAQLRFPHMGAASVRHCRNRLEHSSGSPVTAYQIRRQPQARRSGSCCAEFRSWNIPARHRPSHPSPLFPLGPKDTYWLSRVQGTGAHPSHQDPLSAHTPSSFPSAQS